MNWISKESGSYNKTTTLSAQVILPSGQAKVLSLIWVKCCVSSFCVETQQHTKLFCAKKQAKTAPSQEGSCVTRKIE